MDEHEALGNLIASIGFMADPNMQTTMGKACWVISRTVQYRDALKAWNEEHTRRQAPSSGKEQPS